VRQRFSASDSVVPLDHRELDGPARRARVTKVAHADAEQHTSEAEVAGCWRPHRRRGAVGAVGAESELWPGRLIKTARGAQGVWEC